MAEENVTPVAGKEPPPANPIARPRASTLKLKPVIRKPTIGATGMTKPAVRPGLKLPTQAPAAKSEPAAASAEQPQGGAMEQLKSVTQKLKGVTQEIPQQAILRKTGIIADQDLTEAQKQASKSRTAQASRCDSEATNGRAYSGCPCGRTCCRNAGRTCRRRAFAYAHATQDAQDLASRCSSSFGQVWHKEARCDRYGGPCRRCTCRRRRRGRYPRHTRHASGYSGGSCRDADAG